MKEEKKKAFTYYGGKVRLVDKIRHLTPEYETYVEPFAGSASVLLNLPRCKTEILSDKDWQVAHFFKILGDKDKGEELLNSLKRIEYSEQTFLEARWQEAGKYRGINEIQRAVYFFVLVTQSFNSTRQTFAEGKFASTDEYHKRVLRDLQKVHERLFGVQVMNEDALSLLEKYKGNENAFLFLDPPYRHELRGKNADHVYTYEWEHSDHVRMLRTIQDAKAKIMLCGYRAKKGHELYDGYLLRYGWKCYSLGELTKSCQTKVKRDSGQEFIWVNYELPPGAEKFIELKTYGDGDNGAA